MSPPRINGHVNTQVWNLVMNSKPFAQLAWRMVFTAARAQEARGNRAFFGFGRDLWPDAHSHFESSAQNVLDAMEEVGSFEVFSRGPCTYYVLEEILAGRFSHPDIEASKQYWEWLKEEYFHWTDLKPGKRLLSL